MKNRFLIVNREKIYAYLVSIMTIVVIFFMSSLIDSDLNETEFTASNSVKDNIKNTENNSIGEAISTDAPYNYKNEETNFINNSINN